MRDALFEVTLHYADMQTKLTVRAEDARHAEAVAWDIAARRGWLTLPMAYQRADVRKIAGDER